MGKVSFIDIVFFVFLQSYILCFLFWLCSYRGAGTGPSSDGFMEGFSALWHFCPPFYVGFSPFFCFWDGFSGNNARISLFFAPFRPFLPLSASQPPRGRIQGRIRGMDFFSILVFFSQFLSLFFFFFCLRAGDGFLIAGIGVSSLLSGRILGKNPRFRRFSLLSSSILPFSARFRLSFCPSFGLFSRITAATLLFPTRFGRIKGTAFLYLGRILGKTLSSVSFWLIAPGFYLLSVFFLTFFALFRAERTAYPQVLAYPVLNYMLGLWLTFG